MEELDKRIPKTKIARKFHFTIAQMAREIVQLISAATGVKKVALSGGVFQNQLLNGLVGSELSAAGFTVYRNCLVPPNDGGVSLGQAWIGLKR